MLVIPPAKLHLVYTVIVKKKIFDFTQYKIRVKFVLERTCGNFKVENYQKSLH